WRLPTRTPDCHWIRCPIWPSSPRLWNISPTKKGCFYWVSYATTAPTRLRYWCPKPQTGVLPTSSPSAFSVTPISKTRTAYSRSIATIWILTITNGPGTIPITGPIRKCGEKRGGRNKFEILEAQHNPHRYPLPRQPAQRTLSCGSDRFRYRRPDHSRLPVQSRLQGSCAGTALHRWRLHTQLRPQRLRVGCGRALHRRHGRAPHPRPPAVRLHYRRQARMGADGRELRPVLSGRQSG